MNVLTIAGDTVYVGGNFAVDNDVDGNFERTALAAVDARDGRTLSWRADALAGGDRGNVRELALVRKRLYVGGEFDRLAGRLSDGIGVVNASTGAPMTWDRPSSDGSYSLVGVDDHVVIGRSRNPPTTSCSAPAPHELRRCP